MNKYKSAIVAICLSAGFTQVPAANAQAQLAGPLLQLGMQMAGQLAPMAIPVVVGGGMMVYRAGAMIPAYVKERMPLPHIGAKKKVAAAPEAATAAAGEETDSATESVTGSVISDDKAGAEEVAEAPKAETEQPKAPAKRAPRDASEWYLED
jgi:hypothetical protein